MAFSYYWSKEKQKKWSEKQLINYIKNYVYPYHPYYRRKFKELSINPAKIKSYDDILKLPLTTKEDMVEEYEAFILQPKFPGQKSLYDTAPIAKANFLKYLLQALAVKGFAAETPSHRTLRYRIEQMARREWYPIHFHASGGTTGNPSPALYTWYDIRINTPPLAVLANLCGLELDHRCLNLFPAAPHLAFFQVVMSEFLLGGFVFHTCGGQVVPTERQIELAERGKFDFISAIPSYLTYWLETAERMRKEGKIKIIDTMKFAVVAGEPMVPAYRERLKKQFAAIGSPEVKIIEGYGMTEVKGAFYECDEGSGLHLSPEKYFWEILDPKTKEPVEEGKPGVLTFSHIGWRGTVFLRFYTGDLINGMVWDKCPKCGYTIPRLLTPMCRAVKDFTKIKGARVPLLALQTAVRNSEGVESFQVIITKEKEEDPFSRDLVIVYVAKKEGFDEEKVSNSIRKNVKLDCEISPNKIIFEDTQRLEERLFQRTGLKADWIIDERQVHA